MLPADCFHPRLFQRLKHGPGGAGLWQVLRMNIGIMQRNSKRQSVRFSARFGDLLPLGKRRKAR